MQHSEHLDQEELSLLALGEPGPPAVRHHLAGCAHCREEVAELGTVVTAAREPAEVLPPPHVWEGIAAATGVRTAPRPPLAAPRPLPAAPRPPQVRPPQVRPPQALTRPARTTRRAALPRRRSRARVLTAAVAAIALVAGVAIGAGLTRLGGDEASKQPVLAATRLGGLRLAPDASGRADVVETSAGRELDVDVTDLARPDGFYQVWLIDKSVTRMVPVGVLNGDIGHWSLPDDMNLADYPLVDVSLEKLDGDPAHSGKSVLRGTLAL